MKKIVISAVLIGLMNLPAIHDVYADTFIDPSFVDGACSSVLILPPINNTKRRDASFKAYAFLTTEVGEKGYFVYAPEIVEARLKELKLRDFTNVSRIPFKKLEKTFGAQAVMVVTILDWDIRPYTMIGQEAVIEIRIELYDVRTRKLLFQNQARLRKEAVKTFLVMDDLKDAALDDLMNFQSGKFVKPMPQGKHFDQWGY